MSIDFSDVEYIETTHQGRTITLHVERCPKVIGIKLFQLLASGSKRTSEMSRSFFATEDEESSDASAEPTADDIDAIDVDRAFAPLLAANQMAIDHIREVDGMTFGGVRWSGLDAQKKTYWGNRAEAVLVKPVQEYMLKRMSEDESGK